MTKLFTIFSIFILLFLSSCSDNKIEDSWIVGTSSDNPPYEFMQNGELVGFDIDLMNEIGKHLGKKIEFKNMEFQSVLAALATNNIDLAIDGLSINSERAKKVDFSSPYLSTKIAVLYRAEDKFSSTKDLNEKHNVGAQLGTTWHQIAHELSKTNNFNVTSLSTNLMLVEDLKVHRLDAIILEEAQANKFVEIYKELAKFTPQDLNSSFAIAMPKNSPNKKIIDHAIKTLKNKGEIKRLSKKWGLN